MSFLKKFDTKNGYLLMAIGAVVLVYFLMNYSAEKNNIRDTMENNGEEGQSVEDNNRAMPNDLAGNQYAPVEPSSQTHGLPPSCQGAPVADPSELLPKDQNNEWARLNPNGENDLEKVNLLKAGFHHGIDTIGTSLRNANLQLRSEPPNPVDKVSPWMNSTIEPDLMRTPLELGCGGQ